MDVLDRAATFLHTHARLLERAVFARVFEGGGPGAVIKALAAHQNEDGGFGWAIEPDIRDPKSHPIGVEMALAAMREADAPDEAMVLRACDWLATIGDPAVPPALPSVTDYPCANHWTLEGWALAPAVNPTAGIAGHLHALGIEHEWRDRATVWCIGQLATETYKSGHTLRCALNFLAQLPDKSALHQRIAGQLGDAEWFQLDVPVTTYTMTPLHFPGVPFPDDVIEAHLNDLLRNQQDDGGWPVHWKPPGPAALNEWRGRWTLDALLTLRRHGRV